MLNMDFSQPVIIDTKTQDWIASPRAGVWRKPLAREDAERGHATSIVRYDAGASFSGHNHPGGEEILVLEGTFSDETGDFSAGTYFRNPLGFRHAPFSKQGCLILVKLHQFQPGDETRLAIQTRDAQWQEQADGTSQLPLHSFKTENVSLLKIANDSAAISQTWPGGVEIYVIKGALNDGSGTYPSGTWMRLPPGSRRALSAGEDTMLWVKSGHLGAEAIRAA